MSDLEAAGWVLDLPPTVSYLRRQDLFIESVLNTAGDKGLTILVPVLVVEAALREVEGAHGRMARLLADPVVISPEMTTVAAAEVVLRLGSVDGDPVLAEVVLRAAERGWAVISDSARATRIRRAESSLFVVEL